MFKFVFAVIILSHMDYLLIILGSVFMITGILGCVLPVYQSLPELSRPAISSFHRKYQFFHDSCLFGESSRLLSFCWIISFRHGEQKFGGSKFGVWGSIAGLLIGLFFFPPVGIIAGPFAGAVIGELIAGKIQNPR